MSGIKEYQLFIDGKWIASTSCETIDVVDPSTEEVVGKVQSGTVEDVDKALKSAEKAQRSWKKLPPRERADLLYKFANEIKANTDRLAELLVREQGKLLKVAKFEVAVTASFIEYACERDMTFNVIEKEIEQPSKGEVRIKVAYVGVCGTDVHIYHGMMDKCVSIPETIGHEMSGVIDAIGDGVDGFAIGDKVVVRPLDDRLVKPSDKGFNHICEELKFIGIDSPGAMQEYWIVPAFTLHKLKDDTDLKLAALIEPLSVATHDVRMSGPKAGETAVVLGGRPNWFVGGHGGQRSWC